MRKSLIWGGVLVFLLLVILPFGVQAAEGECHLKYCFVPAPTTYTPAMDEVASSRPAITGLTWKTAVVKVYLDGVELAGVRQVKHEDYYGSFYVRPAFDLTPGRHFVYTIAHSEKPGPYDQSKESIYTYFTVVQKETAVSEASPASPGVEPAESIEIISLEQESEFEIVEPQAASRVEVEKGRIEGGVSVKAELAGEPTMIEKAEEETEDTALQEAATFNQLGDALEGEFKQLKLEQRLKRNRMIGLSILGLAVLVVIIWLVASRNSIKREFKKEAKGDLPPPPQPPTSQPTLIKDLLARDEEIKVEPIEPEEDSAVDSLVQEELDYWAAPPPSPYSPYPPAEADRDELDNRQRD